MQTKHTPGPWHVYQGGNFCQVAPEGYDKKVAETHYLGGAICDLDDWDGTEHNNNNNPKILANARLIAAAPELLEALQTLAAYANGRLDKNPYRIPEYKQALCAIGKATGKNTDGDAWMDANNEAYTTHAKATGR